MIQGCRRCGGIPLPVSVIQTTDPVDGVWMDVEVRLCQRDLDRANEENRAAQTRLSEEWGTER